MNLDQDKLEALERLPLLRGKHRSRAEGQCAMELVSYLAGEPWSDAPACACPILTAFVVRYNDNSDDEQRQLLKPFLPALIGTRGDGKSELRAWLALDWFVREAMPAWLDLAGSA